MHNLTVVNNSARECNYLSEVAAAVMLHGDGDGDYPVNEYERCPRQGTILNTIAPNQYIDDGEAVRLCGVKVIDFYDINPYLVGIMVSCCGYYLREREFQKHDQS